MSPPKDRYVQNPQSRFQHPERAGTAHVGRLPPDGLLRSASAKAYTRLAVPVKLVWTSERFRSHTTSSGGFSKSSRYCRSCG